MLFETNYFSQMENLIIVYDFCSDVSKYLFKKLSIVFWDQVKEPK